jgi:ribonuclease P/MRP protein subunit POP1
MVPKRHIPEIAQCAIGTMLPRALFVHEFAQARAQDIALLQQYNNAKQKTRAFQTLPKHLRRRAMSHNPYRVYINLRQKAIQEYNPSEKNNTKSKRKRGKGKRYRQRYFGNNPEWKRRSLKNKWLQTHVWHAKRMHMINAWGFKLALHCNDKNKRFVCKSAKLFCTISDTSYFGAILLSSESMDTIILLLEQFIPPFHRSAVRRVNILDGRKVFETFFYLPGRYPFGGIAPVTCLFRPENVPNALIFVHPSVFSFVLEAMSYTCVAENLHVHIRDISEKLQRFELRGNRSNVVLKSALEFLGSKSEPSTVTSVPDTLQEVWNKLFIVSTPDTFPRYITWYLNVNNAKNDKLPPHARDKYTFPSDLDVSDAFQKLRGILKDWPGFSSINDSVNLSPSFWEFLSSTEDSSEHLGMILLQKPGLEDHSQFGSGWDVLLPKTWGNRVFQTLVHAGARAVGILERSRLHLECGEHLFPNYHPDTISGRNWRFWSAQTANLEHNRRPKAKRLNYKALGVEDPLPFLVPWSSLFEQSECIEEENYLDSRYSFLSRVQEGPNEVIPYFIIRDPAVKRYISGGSSPASGLDLEYGLIEVHVVISGEQSDKGSIRDHAGLHLIGENGELLECIGYVIDSCFSLLRGRSFGIALVRALPLRHTLISGFPYLYLCNVSTPEILRTVSVNVAQ